MANAIVARLSGVNIGQIKVPLTPLENDQATSKKYVDDSVKAISDLAQGISIVRGDLL